MAVLDFTETPAIDRETASRLNPFIGCASIGDTLGNVSDGLEFLNIAACALADDGSNEAAGGFSDVLRAMSIAMAFEIETERVDRHRHLQTHAQEQGGAL